MVGKWNSGIAETCPPVTRPQPAFENHLYPPSFTQLHSTLEIRLRSTPYTISVRIKFLCPFGDEPLVPHAELLFRWDFSGASLAVPPGGLSFDAIIVENPVAVSGATLGA